MEIKKKLSLPIYENWIAFKEDHPSHGHSEYEMLSDAILTGDNTTDFGPYQFLTTCDRNPSVKVASILRLDLRLPQGTITKYQVEKIGLSWEDISEKLIKNGWAELVNATVVYLTLDMEQEKEQMSNVFGNSFSKILPILQQVYYVIPSMITKTDTECYHGGDLVDEVTAIVSVFTGVRVKAGRLIREFKPTGDRFGTPVGWYNVPITPDVKPVLYGRYKLPSVLHDDGVESLEQLKYLCDLSKENLVYFVKAARLYQQALWIAESDPSSAWIMFVSALETAANQWNKKQDTPATRLEYANKELYDYLLTLKDPDIVNVIAGHIVDSLGASKKFIDFVINFLPPAPSKRPPVYVQCQWENIEMQEILKTVYTHRSRALHGGTPFPLPMCDAPIYLPGFLAPAEKPMGLGAHAKGATWLAKDAPILLNTFEYITRNCLLKWWSYLRERGS